MIKIEVNSLSVVIKSYCSVLEVCKYAGISVPRFCYHDILSVSGNCRMCLVEIDDHEKPYASCVTQVKSNMSIKTESIFVKKSRENVIETLLLNHPLDCPICDQAGECDLQDQSKLFGSDKSKFFFNRRHVEDKNCGPLIKTIMTRCIHCTRCVRFGTEIAGLTFFGTFNRGTFTEIGSYVSKMFDSEISGHVIDLCPVGALTSNVYAFQARPWELNTCESVDLSDSLISDVYLNYRDSEIYRILPKTSVQINKSIISDKARFSFDFNRNSRMNYIYQNVDKTLLLKNWEELVNIIPTFELSNNMPSLIFYVNQELDLMNLNYLNNLSFLTSGKIKVRNLYYYKDSSNFYNASLLDSVNCLNEKKDIIVFFSSNIKLECAVLNALIKLKSTFNLGSIYSLGLNYKSNLPINFINLNFSNCFLIFESKNAILSKKIISSFNFLIIFGNSFFKLIFSSNNLFKIIKKKIINSNILNISQFCNTQGSKYLNILSSNTKLIKKKNLIFGVNLDDIFNTRKYFNNFKNNFFWLNTHVSDICFKSSAIIPILTSFEQEEIHLNLENRSKKTENLLLSPFDARSLQQIITSLFKKNIIIKKNLFFDHILESANNSELFEFNHSLLGKDFMLNDISSVEIELITNYPLKSQIEDFYRSNKNTKNSLVMISCSREKRKNIFNF